MSGTSKGNKGKGKNPKLQAASKKTRFGQPGGNIPHGLTRNYHPTHVRSALSHFAAQEVDPRKLKESMDALLGHHKFSIAEMIAYKRLHKALSGDNHAMDRVEDALCGKLPDTHIFQEKEKSPKYVPSKTLEEAQARVEELNKE